MPFPSSPLLSPLSLPYFLPSFSLFLSSPLLFSLLSFLSSLVFSPILFLPSLPLFPFSPLPSYLLPSSPLPSSLSPASSLSFFFFLSPFLSPLSSQLLDQHEKLPVPAACMSTTKQALEECLVPQGNIFSYQSLVLLICLFLKLIEDPQIPSVIF